ncbi:MAG: hypothetical protein LBU47_05100 [Christensenellaceae bacterium]|jgi:uroporphyrinogen decarboxylase|nr:hypothetical protein [Christensenellaceae bacterium]
MNAMTKRERVLKAFNNQTVDRVPVGFWFHFLGEEELSQALTHPELRLLEQNIHSHQKYIEDFDPDFVKIMSDGYFLYPRVSEIEPQTAADLYRFKPIGADHPWIQDQVKIVKSVAQKLDGACCFYNIFAPANILRINIGYEPFFRIWNEDKAAVAFAAGVIAEDLALLAKLVVEEGGADGIYLSVQNPENRISAADYFEFIAPSDKAVLAAANALTPYNILHCCGYGDNKNDLSIWKDYDAKAVNWATAIEGVSLVEGKQLFGGKAVIGGFDNRAGKLLHKGTKAEIEKEVEQILSTAGKIGVILGADCTVPPDLGRERFDFVRNKAIALG